MYYHLYSPTIREGLAFDLDLGIRHLRGIDVLANGTLFVLDIHGNTVSYPFTGVTSFVRLPLQIKKIIGNGSGAIGDGVTGTNIAIASLRGLV